LTGVGSLVPVGGGWLRSGPAPPPPWGGYLDRPPAVCEDWKVEVLDITFDKAEGPDGLKNTLTRINREVNRPLGAGRWSGRSRLPVELSRVDSGFGNLELDSGFARSNSFILFTFEFATAHFSAFFWSQRILAFLFSHF